MKLEYAKNPVYVARDGSAINLTVKFEGRLSEEPFTAMLSDPEDYGRDIYARAATGEFGSVSTFNVEPPSISEIEQTVRQARNYKLEVEVDPVVSNPLRWNSMSPEQQQSYVNYRQALLDVTSNPDFPWYSLVVVEDNYGYNIEVSNVPWPVRE